MKLIDRIEISGLRPDHQPVLRLNPLQWAEREEYLARLERGEYTEAPVKACPLCACAEGWLVAAKDRYGLPVKTVVCRNCGLLFTANPLDHDSTVRFYAQQYRRLYKGKEMTGPEWAAYSSKWFEQRLDFPDFPALRMRGLTPAELARMSVVELGCGAGWNLLGFHRRGAQVLGFDYDGQLIEEGRRRGMRMETGSADEAIGLGAKADLVILSHVMEHVASPVEFMTKVGRILKPGGKVFIIQPGLKSFQFGSWGGGLGRQLQNAHNFIFEAATLKLLAAATGYSTPFCNEGLKAVLIHSGPETPPEQKLGRGEKTMRYLARLKLIEHVWTGLGSFKGGEESRPYRWASRAAAGAARRMGYPI